MKKTTASKWVFAVIVVLLIVVIKVAVGNKCDLCGSRVGVRFVKLYSESYYLCDKHYKEFVLDSKKSNSYSYSYSGSNNSYSSGSVSTTPTQTTGQRNAVKTAKQYLNTTGFSRLKLIDQLEYEGYTHEEAVYAADNCGANWNEQAALCASRYLQYSGFSRARLIDQLEYEKFTHEQAVYGVEQNGY